MVVMVVVVVMKGRVKGSSRREGRVSSTLMQQVSWWLRCVWSFTLDLVAFWYL